jgi:hypothetical protein
MRALALATLAVLCAHAPAAAETKMAQNGACYASNDPYNVGIIPLQTFATLDDCVAAGGWDRRAWGVDPWNPPVEGGPTHGMVYRNAPNQANTGQVYRGNVYRGNAQATMDAMTEGKLRGTGHMEGTVRGPVHMEGYASTHATPHGSAHGTVYGPTHGAMYGPTNGTMYRSPYGTPHGPTDGPLALPTSDWAPLPALPVVATRAAVDAEATLWLGESNSCRTLRDDLLVQLSRAPVTFSVDGCSVATGVWVDATMGTTLHDPNAVAIGHVVPPAWADSRGAAGWDAGQRAAFYRDPNNLIALSLEGQTARAAQGMTTWGPHSATQACTMANAFATVVHRHRLETTAADVEAIRTAHASACQAPADLWEEGLALERDGFTHAERTGFDATRGVIRTPRDTAVRFAADGTHTAVPFAADAQGRPVRGVATGNSMVHNPASLHTAPLEPTLVQSMRLAPEDPNKDAGVVAAEKPPIALPGRLTQPTAAPTDPEPTAPTGTTNTQSGAMRDQTPPEEPTVVYELTDFNGMRLEQIVEMVNENTIVRGMNDDGSALDPAELLRLLGFPPNAINAAAAEAFDEGDPELSRTVTSPLGGPPVQTDPNLPPFDADPMMLGIGAAGAGMEVAQ